MLTQQNYTAPRQDATTVEQSATIDIQPLMNCLTIDLDLIICDSRGNSEADVLIEALQLCQHRELEELRKDAGVLAEGNPAELTRESTEAMQGYLFRIERTRDLIRRIRVGLDQAKTIAENKRAFERDHIDV